MAVDRVVAEVGLAADEPARERRPRIVEHLLAGAMPVDQLRLLGPETFTVLDRAPVELTITRPILRHRPSVAFSRCAEGASAAVSRRRPGARRPPSPTPSALARSRPARAAVRSAREQS